ncbi:type III secretion system translocon subunit SctE [Glaciimonas sp. PCH181]|uniref:type III secretion system translocon subunit SctE n=1 Tax=Glaciimonas sp. PCH181 TaxID=2133943 RepID=UPI000D3B6336|nr:type III secretion system translocon subunit SctE [Glaciimonas sp. PCH181]PUA19943.1 hypothetical protein C7W93_09085 [Glaciimonas sp. PCH181]
MVDSVSGFERIRANADLFDAAKVNVRKSGDFMGAAQEAHKNLIATSWQQDADNNAGAFARDGLARPLLAQPKREAGLSSEATMTKLFAELVALLGAGMVSDLKNRLGIFKNMMSSQQQHFAFLELNAMNALKEEAIAIDQIEGLAAEAEAAMAALKAIDNRIAELKSLLSSNNLTAQQRKEFDTELSEKSGMVEPAIKSIWDAVGVLAKAKLIIQQKAAAVVLALDALVEAAKGQVVGMGDLNLSKLTHLNLLMAELIKTLGENSTKALKNSLSLFEAMQVSRQAAMEKAAESFDAQVRKAEEAQKIAGCIGNIISALILVAAVVATVATFGVATAVGLAFMVTDAAVGGITGQSLTDRALSVVMEPLMKNVIMPMMEFVQKEISAVLTDMGIAKDLVEKISAIMTTVITAIAVIVMTVLVMVVGQAVASKMASLIGKVIRAAAKKMVPKFATAMVRVEQVVGRAATQVSQKMGFKTDELSAQMYAKNFGHVQNGMTMAHSGVQGAGGIVVGQSEEKAASAAADFMKSENMMRQLSEFIKRAMDEIPSDQNMIHSMTTALSKMGANEANTGRLILAGARQAGRRRA